MLYIQFHGIFLITKNLIIFRLLARTAPPRPSDAFVDEDDRGSYIANQSQSSTLSENGNGNGSVTSKLKIRKKSIPRIF